MARPWAPLSLLLFIIGAAYSRDARATPAGDERDPAQARLDDIRARFATRPKAVSLAALAALADELPASPAAGRALTWLGQLEEQAAALAPSANQARAARARADTAFRRAYQGTYSEDIHRLAARGLGDLALAAQSPRRARAYYAEAGAGANGVLAAELEQKLALATRLERRGLLEGLGWLVLAGVLAFFVVRARPWQRPWPRLPVEAIYVLPVYALLVLGCVGRDADVLRALLLAGLGSLALIAAAGVAARRQPPTGAARWAHLGLVLGANLALFYAALNHAALIDHFVMTVAP